MGHFLAAAKIVSTVLGIASAAKSLTAKTPQAPKLQEPVKVIAMEESKRRKTRIGLLNTTKTGFKGLTDKAPTQNAQLGGAPLKTTLGG